MEYIYLVYLLFSCSIQTSIFSLGEDDIDSLKSDTHLSNSIYSIQSEESRGKENGKLAILDSKPLAERAKRLLLQVTSE